MGLLFDERPLVLSPTLATELGNLNEAVFVQQLHYWLEIKKSSGKNFVNGRYWIYNTVEEWIKQFPWLSSATLRRTIDSLVKKGYVIKGNFNQKKMDRTIWYSLNYDKITEIDKKAKAQKEELSRIALDNTLSDENPETLVAQKSERIAQNEQSELSKSANRIAQNEQIELLKMSKSNCSKQADRIAQNEQSNTIDYPYTNPKTTTTEASGAQDCPSEEVAAEDALTAYNELCPSFPSAIGVTPRRKELVRALSDNGITMDMIREAFRLAEASDFLTGRSKCAEWDRFDFDWLVSPSNIISLLEGKYDNMAAQKRKRIERFQSEFRRPVDPPVEPLTEDQITEYPAYLKDALKQHNLYPVGKDMEVLS